MNDLEIPNFDLFSSRSVLERYQNDALELALDRAARSPFYAAHFGGPRHESPSRLEDLPFTTKEHLRDAYPFGMLAVSKRDLATYHESSGTTGEPVASYFTERDWHDIATRFSRSAVDLGPGDAVLVKTPYAMLTTAHQMHRAARLRGAFVVPADNRSSIMPYGRVLRLLRDVPIHVAWCMPTEPLLWWEAARSHGVKLDELPAFRALLVAGEPLSPARKRRLGELFGGAGVFEDYGSTETGSLAGECAGGRLHLWADRFVPEVVDPNTGSAAREGRGKLAITTLFREAMPLVRFLLEDDVEIAWGECACGWALPTIRVLGRPASGMRVGNVDFSFAALDDIVFSLPRHFDVCIWRARPAKDSLLIEAEAGEEQRANVERALSELVSARTGLRTTVRAVARGTIVSHERLRAETPFSKPRFVFREDEDWSCGLLY